MNDVKSKVALQKQFEDLPDQTKIYLKGLEHLLSSPATFAVALAYLFMKLEEGNHRALKCGLIRIHRCNSSKVDEALEKQHFTRTYFRAVFKNVFGKEVDAKVLEYLAVAEGTRDRLIHGKGVSDPELRKAIANSLLYIVGLGAQVEITTKKNPFGNLSGLAGKTLLMESVPSYWLLKGLGFFKDKPS